MTTEKRWFVGVDWATEEHAVCIVDAQGKLVGERVFKHTGSALAEMCTWLLKVAGDDPAALDVAIEVPHGPVVETLLERGIRVHAINPKQLDRFRDRFTVAGAKDDRRDAYVLADSLRTDMQCFRRLRLDESLVIELREWSRIAHELQEDRVRFGNRLQQQLLRYYPQMLELADDVANDSFLALWELLPTPQHASRARERAVASLLKEQRIRRFDAKHVLKTLRQKPLTVAAGTTEAASAHIASLAARLRLVNRQLKDARRKLDVIIDALGTKEDEPGQKCEQRDVDILRSLPGVGRIVLATLLTEASQPLAQRDYAALRLLCGVAPVTRNSGKRQGKRSIVVMRYACHMRLRDAVYHWARVASQVEPRSRAAYAELRARGHSHGRSLRTIGDRLLCTAVAMLRDRTLFDPSRRLAA
jgi:transposase